MNYKESSLQVVGHVSKTSRGKRRENKKRKERKMHESASGRVSDRVIERKFKWESMSERTCQGRAGKDRERRRGARKTMRDSE